MVALLVLWNASTCAAEPVSEDSRLVVKDVVAGPNLEAVLTALPELARRNLDYRKYRILVCTEGDQLSVVFIDLDKSFARPGRAPTLTGIEIDLSADGKQVTGFKWQR